MIPVPKQSYPQHMHREAQSDKRPWERDAGGVMRDAIHPSLRPGGCRKPMIHPGQKDRNGSPNPSRTIRTPRVSPRGSVGIRRMHWHNSSESTIWLSITRGC